jgi:hypothetical protein
MVSERWLGHDAYGWADRAGARDARAGGARGLTRLSERVLARGTRAGEAVGTLVIVMRLLPPCEAATLRAIRHVVQASQDARTLLVTGASRRGGRVGFRLRSAAARQPPPPYPSYAHARHVGTAHRHRPAATPTPPVRPRCHHFAGELGALFWGSRLRRQAQPTPPLRHVTVYGGYASIIRPPLLRRDEEHNRIPSSQPIFSKSATKRAHDVGIRPMQPWLLRWIDLGP